MSVRSGLFWLSAVVAFGLSACAPDGKQAPPKVAEQAPATPQKVEVKPPPPPLWRMGDRWSYSDEYAIEVSEVMGGGTVKFRLADGRDQWMVRKAFFTEASHSDGVARQVVFRTSDPMQLFAVPLGTTVAFIRETMRNGELLRHKESWVFEGKETITVPAGTFDCWVVVMRVTSLETNYQAYERWWYSPEARNYVRSEFKAGDHPESSRVLMTYRVNPAQGENNE